MPSEPIIGRLILFLLALALPAGAQLDSAALRAKYGAPLDRETYHMPSGFDLTVDYGASHQACKLQVPALMPSDETISNSDVMRLRMYVFLSELLPDSIRGKELRRGTMMSGAHSVVFVEYENVSLAESKDGNQPFAGTITVTFRNQDCQKPSGQ
jgi:hypothetical protein